MFVNLVEYSLVCALSGICAGFLAGLFGIGGGVVIVPALYFLFSALKLSHGHAMAMAIATSLATILPTSISSLRAHHRLHNVDWAFVRTAAPALIAGATSGALLVSFFAGYWLSVVFGFTLIGVAWLVFNKGFRDASTEPGNIVMPRWLIRVAMALVAGLSSIAGVGGGALGAPMLVATGYPVHKAVGTASSFGLLIALPSIITVAMFSTTPGDAPPYSLGLISLPAWALISVFTVRVAPLGAAVGKRLSDKHLAAVLALLLVVLGLKMLFSAFSYYFGST